MDTNLLVAFSTLALALITAIMVYFTAKSVTSNSLSVHLSALSLLTQEKKEVLQRFKDMYGLDEYNPSPDKIAKQIEYISKFKPLIIDRFKEDCERFITLQIAIQSLRKKIIPQIISRKEFRNVYKELFQNLGLSEHEQYCQ